MSLGLGKLRGAVSKVMTDARDNPESGKKADIWTELARGMKKASDQQTEGEKEQLEKEKDKMASRRKMKTVVHHLDAVFNKPEDTSEADIRIEEQLQVTHLEQLKAEFEQREAAAAAANRQRRSQTSRPPGELTMEEFADVVNGVIGHDKLTDQLHSLYHKLDTDNNGFVSWPEFCNYMMLYFHESERLSDKVEPPFKQEPRMRHALCNRQEPTARLLLTDNPARPISVSKNGAIALWDWQLRPEASLDTQNQQADISSSNRRLFNEWVTDAVFMPNCHKLVVATTGRELKFYDIASSVIKEEYVLYGLRSVPNVLRFHYRKEAAHQPCLLFLADDTGELSTLEFKQPLQLLFDLPPDPNHRSQRVWFHELSAHSRCVEISLTEQLHSDCVNDLVYLAECDWLISCSSSSSDSVLIYDFNKRRPVYTFRLRRGAECFDVSKSVNLLVTGSVDNHVRLWNPYVPARPVALLQGHNNSLLSVQIHPKLLAIISYSRDAVVKVWDAKSYACVQTVGVRLPFTIGDKTPEHLNRPLLLHLQSNTVYVTAADYILQYRLGKVADVTPGVTQTHRQQVSCTVYNPLFRLVTTASDDSSVCTWDVLTGNKGLAWPNAHSGEEVTFVGFDNTWRRMLTGSRHGGLKVWNFQNGQLLHTLERTADAEITGIVTVPGQSRMLAVGWSREIVCYPDVNAEATFRHAVAWSGGCFHQDDILTCDFSPPDLLATGGYDGAVLVWHVEHEKLLLQLREGVHEQASRKVLLAQGLSPASTRANSRSSRRSHNSRPNSRHSRSRQSRTPAACDRLLFLRRRLADRRMRECGSLVTSDGGVVRLWSVYAEEKLLAEFTAATQPEECVLAMAVNQANTRLLTGDTVGCVRFWDIEGYAMHNKEEAPPPCLSEFPAHSAAIVAVDLVQLQRGEFFLTASVDCTVRLFAANGDIIGTFGQPKPWDLSSRKSWKQAQIDRQKLLDEVSDTEMAPVAEPSTEKSPFVTSLDRSLLQQQRSATMPDLTEGSPSIRPSIGFKAERDFARIRTSRSGRRNLFGSAVSKEATVGANCTPYTQLRTAEFQSLSMSSNLPLPSWQLRKAHTTVGQTRTRGEGQGTRLPRVTGVS